MLLQFVLLDVERGLAMALMPDASLAKLHALLDAETFEIVSVNIEGQDYYLLVDENGKLNNKPLNNPASIAASQPILGNAAALMPDDFKALPFNMEQENDTMQ